MAICCARFADELVADRTQRASRGYFPSAGCEGLLGPQPMEGAVTADGYNRDGLGRRSGAGDQTVRNRLSFFRCGLVAAACHSTFGAEVSSAFRILTLKHGENSALESSGKIEGVQNPCFQTCSNGGNRTVMVVPSPGRLATSIVP